MVDEDVGVWGFELCCILRWVGGYEVVQGWGWLMWEWCRRSIVSKEDNGMDESVWFELREIEDHWVNIKFCNMFYTTHLRSREAEYWAYHLWLPDSGCVEWSICAWCSYTTSQVNCKIWSVNALRSCFLSWLHQGVECEFEGWLSNEAVRHNLQIDLPYW